MGKLLLIYWTAHTYTYHLKAISHNGNGRLYIHTNRPTSIVENTSTINENLVKKFTVLVVQSLSFHLY